MEGDKKILPERRQDGTVFSLAIKSIVSCFALILHAETVLKSTKKPIPSMVLPMLKIVKLQLYKTKTGIVNGNSLEVQHSLTQTLANVKLFNLQEIPIYDLRAAFCVLHLGLNTF